MVCPLGRVTPTDSGWTAQVVDGDAEDVNGGVPTGRPQVAAEAQGKVVGM